MLEKNKIKRLNWKKKTLETKNNNFTIWTIVETHMGTARHVALFLISILIHIENIEKYIYIFFPS
jgi:hypothetical protein